MQKACQKPREFQRFLQKTLQNPEFPEFPKNFGETETMATRFPKISGNSGNFWFVKFFEENVEPLWVL